MGQMNDVTTETSHHTIKANASGVTITTKHARNAVYLTPEEAKALLEVLLVWQSGLETVSPNDQDA